MFKELDIRGKYPSEINEEKMFLLGKAVSKKEEGIIAGMDFRKNNGALLKSFSYGFQKDMLFLGAVPTPLVAYSSVGFGMMLTASHNPADYSGAKFFRKGTYITKDEMQGIKKEYEKIENELKDGKKHPKEERPLKYNINSESAKEHVDNYLDSIPEINSGIFDLAGGAVCGLKELFPKSIFNAPDPEFKLHSPEPKEDTLIDLRKLTIKDRKLGFAFDGDGDRLQICDSGKLIEGDITAAFVCEYHLKRGDAIVLSVDCRQEVFEKVSDLGIKAITSKVGDAYVVEKALKVGAIFSAERSGHFTFYNHSSNSDGIYAAAALSTHENGEFLEFSQQFKNVTIKEEIWHKVDFDKLKELLEEGTRKLAPTKIETIDGIKAIFEDFTLLVRQSTTEPKVRINSEGEDMQKAKEGMRFAKELVSKTKIH